MRSNNVYKVNSSSALLNRCVFHFLVDSCNQQTVILLNSRIKPVSVNRNANRAHNIDWRSNISFVCSLIRLYISFLCWCFWPQENQSVRHIFPFWQRSTLYLSVSLSLYFSMRVRVACSSTITGVKSRIQSCENASLGPLSKCQ